MSDKYLSLVYVFRELVQHLGKFFAYLQCPFGGYAMNFFGIEWDGESYRFNDVIAGGK